MARYQTIVNTQGDVRGLEGRIMNYMDSIGFQKTTFKGEEVYKKGMGLLSAPQFIKITMNERDVIVEAWLKYAILPGLYVGEMGITGVIGALPKKALNKKVTTICDMIARNF